MSTWLQGVDGRAVTRQFMAKVAQGGEALADLSMAVTTFVRTRLRESGITRRLLMVEHCHPDDLDRDENKPGVFKKIVELEPDSTALVTTIRGDGDGVFVRADAVALYFGAIRTPIFEAKVEELMWYQSPITKLIEENSVRDQMEIEDYKFWSSMEQGVLSAASGTHRAHFRNTFADGTIHPELNRYTVARTAALLAGNERRAATVIMSQADVMKLASEDAAIIGDDLASKITVNGWEYADLFGMRLLASIKSVSRSGKTFTAGTVGNGDQIALTRQGLAPLDEGRAFFTDEPERLGKFFSLEESTFYIKQEFGIIRWQLAELIAMGLVNTGSVAICDVRLCTPNSGTWRPSTVAADVSAYDTALIA
jgi:hypothetical protein